MNTDKEFVPYQQSLDMKSIGFDEPCFGWFRSTLIPSNFTEYFLETEFGMNESPSDWVNSNFLEEACSAPLYQQAFRWFREKYGFDSSIALVANGYGFYVHKDRNYTNNGESYGVHITYEEAEQACLIFLIKLVKNNNK